MNTRSTAVLFAGLCFALSVFSLASGQQHGVGQAGSAKLGLSRFGRQLRSIEQSVDSYLLPTVSSSICTGPDCCQEDDYASPYRVQMANSTKAVVGGRTYTTFYLNLLRTFNCFEEVDAAGCCHANVTTIWVDVDPNLQVKFATLNGRPAAIAPAQDGYGFRMSVVPSSQNASFHPTMSTLTVTVLGDVQQLCPLSTLAPVPGLCDVIIEGGTDSRAGACCPRGLSLPSLQHPAPDVSMQCVDDLASSGLGMQLAAMSAPFSGSDGSTYANYTFTVNRASSCTPGPNSCCQMTVTRADLLVSKDVNVVGAASASTNLQFKVSLLDAAGMQSMRQLTITSLPDTASTVTITIRLSSGATVVPELCENPDSNDSVSGPCKFTLYSDDGFCCPSGATNSLAVGGRRPPSPPSPPPSPPPLPPAPAGTCDPQYSVPIADTSMTFQYYDKNEASSSTSFAFLLTNHNNSACPSRKAYCTDVCGWELFVRDDVAGSLTFTHEDASNSNLQTVKRGANASVAFQYGPLGEQSLTYNISSPVAHLALESLCQPNALPGQGDYPCAAIIKSTTNVRAVVFFNETDRVIKDYQPPSPPPAGVCVSARSMDASCIRVNSASFNYPESNTVLDFLVGNNDPATTNCTAEAADVIVTFKVMLKPSVVAELQQQRQLLPRDTVNFDSAQGSVLWTWTPPSVNTKAHYSISLSGQRSISDICSQGMYGQPDNTCAVQFEGRQHCFIGFVKLDRDNSLIWVGESSSSSSNKVATIVPAVVVPVVVLLALLAALLLFVRRRRRKFERQSSASNDLQAPLSPNPELQRPSLPERSTSDIHISLGSNAASPFASR